MLVRTNHRDTSSRTTTTTPATCDHLFLTAFYYRPLTKLWQGKVFSRVCLSVILLKGPMWPLQMMHWTSPHKDPPKHLNMGPHCTAPAPPRVQGTPLPNMFKLVHYEPRKLGILLECFLVHCLRPHTTRYDCTVLLTRKLTGGQKTTCNFTVSEWWLILWQNGR